MNTQDWPVEALLDLLAPLPEDGYPADYLERREEVARRYHLDGASEMVQEE